MTKIIQNGIFKLTSVFQKKPFYLLSIYSSLVAGLHALWQCDHTLKRLKTEATFSTSLFTCIVPLP